MTLADFDRITVDSEVLGGKGCMRGLRMSVGMIVQMVAAGKSTKQIIDEYPYLEVEDVRQALANSAHLAQNEYHLVPDHGARTGRSSSSPQTPTSPR